MTNDNNNNNNNNNKVASASLLAPKQLGFGVPGGAEAAIRAARRYLDNMQQGQLFLKIDFRNVFNALRRCHSGSDCQAFSKAAIPYATSTMNSASDLQFGEFVRRRRITRGSTQAALLLPRLQGATGVPSVRAGSWLPGRRSRGRHCGDHSQRLPPFGVNCSASWPRGQTFEVRGCWTHQED